MPSMTSENNTASLSIVPRLRHIIEQYGDEVQEWFSEIFGRTPPFFYTSVDIRHSGFKMAPVDTNVFPAGFNNLTPEGKQRAIQATTQFLEHYYPSVERILIVPENHTRNLFYLDNLHMIESIIKATGKEVVIGSGDETVTEIQTLTSASNHTLSLHPLIRDGNQLMTKDGFIPELIVTNNDFTTGAPDILQSCAQPIIPPLGMGWYQRRKTSHFGVYNELASRFCYRFDLDPWLISTLFHKCGVVNFKERKGIECVALGIDKTIHAIQQKYNEYGIKETPYVFIKSNQGTYGMGIITARSGQEILDINKKSRNKLHTIKGGAHNTEVIIQEGVPTIDKVGDDTAEHMAYLVGGKTVDCLYRINDQRDAYGNLNAAGMRFEHAEQAGGVCKAVATIAELASFAAAWECYEESYQI